MKIVMTGGGTGGHIYPALAIADRFVKEDPETEVLYIGDKNCMESTIVPDYGYRFRDVPAEEVDRRNVFKLVKTAVKNIQGISEAKKILREFKPDAVIGTGGFVSFPVIFAAARLGIKCYIHEQNAFPGLANRSLEKSVSKVFLGFDAARKYFKAGDKIVVTGNPVRDAFYALDKKECREKLGIPGDDFVILSFGGSLGAEKINTVMLDVLKQVNGEEGITLIMGTGRLYYDRIKEKLSEDGTELSDNIKVMPYIDDMEKYLGAADLMVSRAGALTIAEAGAAGRASVMVPSPNVTGNHQYYNAKVMADSGAAILIEESEFGFDSMMREIVRLLNDRGIIDEMEECARKTAGVDTTGIIYETIMKDLDR